MLGSRGQLPPPSFRVGEMGENRGRKHPKTTDSLVCHRCLGLSARYRAQDFSVCFGVPSFLSCEPSRGRSQWPACDSLLCRLCRCDRSSPCRVYSGASHSSLPSPNCGNTYAHVFSFSPWKGSLVWPESRPSVGVVTACESRESRKHPSGGVSTDRAMVGSSHSANCTRMRKIFFHRRP